MKCRATWTGCVPTNDVVARTSDYNPATFYKVRWDTVIPDGVAVMRQGDELKRLDRPVLTCHKEAGHTDSQHSATPDGSIEVVDWEDGLPGATSHADNTPPDDEPKCPCCKGVALGRGD